MSRSTRPRKSGEKRTPAHLDAEHVERQIRRAQRWDLPASIEAYPERPRIDAFAIVPSAEERSYRRRRRGLLFGLAAAVILNVAVLSGLAWIKLPASLTEPPELVLQVPEFSNAAPLEQLAVDIRTPLGGDGKWDHLDQAVGIVVGDYAPLATPSVKDQLVGNPLNLSAMAGGDMSLGGKVGLATRGLDHSGAKINGVRAKGERFVFVLDNTLAMRGAAWRQARREVLAGVSRLEAGQRFAVLLCSGEVYPPLGTPETSIFEILDGIPEAKHPNSQSPAGVASILNPSTTARMELEQTQRAQRVNTLWHSSRPDAVALLAQWLFQQRLVASSLAEDTMAASLGFRSDAIYVIGGAAFRLDYAERIRRENRWTEQDRLKLPGSIIHAIGIGRQPSLAEGAQKLAADGGGHFHFVKVE